jgi:hypothetical protein
LPPPDYTKTPIMSVLCLQKHLAVFYNPREVLRNSLHTKFSRAYQADN